jgi:hypothetical protein
MPMDDTTPDANTFDPVLAWIDRVSEGHRRMYADPAYRAGIERRIERMLRSDNSVAETDVSTAGSAAEINSEPEFDQSEG